MHSFLFSFDKFVRTFSGRIARPFRPGSFEASFEVSFKAGLHAPLVSHAEFSEIAARMAAARAANRSGVLVQHRHPGESRSVHFGAGLDFEEPRRYQPGDDVRHMDWRITARTGHPHVKVYREEHQPGLHLMIDRGAGMRFGTHRRLKVAQAVRVAAFFAFGAAPENAPIGATFWEPEELALLAGAGERGATHLLGLANRPCPPLDTISASKQRSFAQVLSRLAESLPRGTRIVLLSDFAQLDDGCSAALARLAAHHKVIAVQILDAAEVVLPNVGMARFEDCGRTTASWIDTASQAVRTGYRHRAQQQHARQESTLRKAGVQFFRIMADADGFELIHWIAGHG